jgi:hypothetical protein
MNSPRSRENAASILAFAACLGVAAGAALASGGAPGPGKVVCPPTCGGYVDYEECYYTCCKRGFLCGYCTTLNPVQLVWLGCDLIP